jgi:small subunit ribosomal protein S17
MMEEQEERSEAEAASDAPSPSASDAAPTSDEQSPTAADAASSSSADAGPSPRVQRRERAQAERAAQASRRPQRSPEERQAERQEARRAKAVARRRQRQRARAKARAASDSGVQTPPREHQRGSQKIRQGVVVSDRAAKTITVRIDVARRHRRYSKIVRTSTTLHAHDERGEAGIGDTVLVRESRPLSRSKRWRLVEVVERAR